MRGSCTNCTTGRLGADVVRRNGMMSMVDVAGAARFAGAPIGAAAGTVTAAGTVVTEVVCTRLVTQVDGDGAGQGVPAQDVGQVPVAAAVVNRLRTGLLTSGPVILAVPIIATVAITGIATAVVGTARAVNSVDGVRGIKGIRGIRLDRIRVSGALGDDAR
jgi:hypothetical protein